MKIVGVGVSRRLASMDLNLNMSISTSRIRRRPVTIGVDGLYKALSERLFVQRVFRDLSHLMRGYRNGMVSSVLEHCRQF